MTSNAVSAKIVAFQKLRTLCHHHKLGDLAPTAERLDVSAEAAGQAQKEAAAGEVGAGQKDWLGPTPHSQISTRYKFAVNV